MPEPRYSPQEFAQILKQKYPQYSDVEDSVLVEKILEKYPQYSNSVDVGLKKKDVGQSIGTGEETSSTDSKSIMFPTPSSSGSENQIPRPVLSQSLSESLNKFAEEVKQDPSQYKEAIERGQNTDLKKILPDVKDEETNKRVAERIKDNFLLGVGELVDAAKTLGYAVGPGYDPTMATINAFDANKRAEDFKETMYQSEKGFIESISEGNFTEAATIGLETTARSAPLMILSAISGGGAGGYLAISTLYAAQTYNESVNQKWFQDMTPVEKAGYSSLIGGLESVGEMAGGKVLRGASKDFMRGLIGKKAFEQTVGEFTRGAFKAVGLGMSEEAIGEFVTGFGQSIVQQAAQQGIENIDIIQSFADGFEGAALGAFSGGLISTVGQAPNAVSMANSIGVKNSKIKNRKAIIDLSAKFEEAQTKEEKTAIAELLDIAIQNDASDVNRSIDLYEVMQKESPEDFNYVHQLDSSLRRKINQYEASTDPQVKKALRSEIVKISELKYEIERKYDSEEEAGTPGPVVEGETPIEGQPIEVPSAEAPETNRVVQAQEALILEALGSDATLTAVENGTEVDQADTEIAQEKILNLIDVVSNSDMAEESKAIYIQTLEDKFDELEYYDNKTITTAEQVTERVPVGAPKRIIKEEVGGEIKRGKLKIYERLENVEVATGGEADGQTSVVEVQDDGALDVVTYDTKTKQEVSRNQKIADSVLGLEYVESIFNKDGNVSGVVLRPFTPKGQDESPLRLEVKDRPDLSLDLAIDARKKQIGTVAPATFEQAYMEVTKTINKKEKAPLKERTVLDKEVAKKEAAPVVKEAIKLRTERSELQKSIAKAERVISKLIPNSGVKIITHETRGDFNKAMAVKSIQGEQKYAIEYGRFIPSKNEIHINLEDSDAEGPLHEAFHAVFLNVFSKGSQTKREETAKEFESGIKRILNAGTAQDIDLAKEMDRFVEEGGYTAEESPEEFLSQLAGFMGVNYTQLSKPTQSKLIQWINSFIAKFLPSLKIKSSNEFVDFMNSFAVAANETTDSRDVFKAASKPRDASELDEVSSKQFDPKAINAALAIVRNVNNKYPEAVKQQVVSAEFKEDKLGKKSTSYDVKSIPYKLIDGAEKYFGKNSVEKLSDKIVSDVEKYQENKEISKGIGWYSNFRTQFQRKFGASLELFGQLLAATSARTPVDINFRQAIDALRQYSKGNFDSLIKDYSKYVDSIEGMSRQDIINSIEVRTKKKKANYTDLDIINEKRKLINEFKDVPLQSNGKKFNANSAKVLQAIYGNWLKQTQGPKTKNFAGNLTGRSYEATIDVWAARYLRRIIYKNNVSRWRIHPTQEGAVEHTVSTEGVTGGDYFFAEEVMRKAAEKLKWNADDLQAFLWFLEKDIWSKNNWTKGPGKKKSSFEDEAAKLLTERYQAGVTTFKDFGTFNKEEFEAAKVELLNTIRSVDGLIVGRVVDSEGEYYSPSGDVYTEPTFDVEFSVDEGTDISSIEAKVIEIGKRYNQEAVLFSKITENKNKNSAPIIEIGLKNPSRNSKTLDAIKEMLSKLGVRGFTVSKDAQGNVLGVRTQYIKEFEGQPISFGEILFSDAEKELRQKFGKNNDISYISSNFVETNVTLIENEKATEIPSDVKAQYYEPVTGGLESISRVAGEPSSPTRPGSAEGLTESSSNQANKVYDNILKESSSKSFKELASASEAGLLIHATKGSFDTFDPQRIYEGNRTKYGYGFYFTSRSSKALDYGNKFIFTPLNKYNFLDIDENANNDFANVLKSLAETRISKLRGVYGGIELIPKSLKTPLDNTLKISSIISGDSKYGKYSIDDLRKFLEGDYILGYREFSKAMLSVGYDGFQTDDFYEAVIFNFEKLNDNLVKDEADYLKESSSKLYSNLLKESSSKKYTEGQQQSQIDAEVDDKVGLSKEWKEKERNSFERFIDLWRLRLQDKYRDIIRVQENIEFAIDKPVGLDKDFRNAETLMYGKAASELNKAEDKVRKIAFLIKKAGLDVQEFKYLLYALHAQERNIHIRIASTDIGESITELRKKQGLTIKEAADLIGIQIEDYRKIEDNTIEKGITQEELGKILNLYGLSEAGFFYQSALVKDGSGMTDADAQEILSKYGVKNLYDPSVSELSVAVSAAVKAVHSLIADTRETMLDSGLESLDTIYVFEKTYKNYVPLQGFADVNAEKYASEILEGGRKLEVRGRVKEAKGRSTEADSPLTQAIIQNTNTIIRAAKNEVMQKLYNLAKANPNKDIWEVIDPEFDRLYKLDKKNGKISQVAKTISDYMLDPSIVSVRIDGQYKFIRFTDQRMAETLRGATVSSSDFIVKYLGKFNRMLSSFITTYDPEFVLRNFSRDIQTAVLNAYSEQELNDGLIKGEQIVGNIIKSVPKSIKAIFNIEGGKGATTEYEKYYKEFVEDGGKTSWFYSKGSEDIANDISGILDGKKESVLDLAGNFVERVNTSVENGVRLSSYIESRKAGISREKAAEFAKNLTVNFNKSGEWGTIANSLYLFFNASVQGTSRLIRTLKPQFKTNDDGTRSLQVTNAQKIVIGIAVLGAIMSMINAALSDDDEDGESFYSKIPDFEKERNIIIMKPNGKGYFKIPLPYGVNVFYVLGSSMADAAQGVQDPARAVTNVLQAAVGSFSPINFPNSDDASKWITKMVAPTVGQIPLSLALNEDYFGRSIYNTNFPFDPTPKPASELSREEGAWAKWLNKATGGSEFRSGFVDINPDKTDFIFETLSGGAGRFVLRSTKSTLAVLNGNWDELEPREIPFARVFYGQPSKYTNLNDYYEKYVLVNQLTQEARGGITPKKEINTILRMQGVNKSVASNLRRYKKLEDNAMRIKDPDKKEAYMLKIDKMRYAEIARFQKAYEKFNIDDIK